MEVERLSNEVHVMDDLFFGNIIGGSANVFAAVSLGGLKDLKLVDAVRLLEKSMLETWHDFDHVADPGDFWTWSTVAVDLDSENVLVEMVVVCKML